MPQPSVSYACGRVGVLRRSALTGAQLERLMAAHTYEEARRTLLDVGFIASETTDFQAAADAHVLKACALLREITPEPEVTDCFLLRYDANNLKILIKCRYLAQKPEFLSQCGTIPVETLRHAVAEHNYRALPDPLREAMDALEKALAARFDPMTVDAEIDRAMDRMIFASLKGKRAKTARAYFVAKVDLQNLIMLLRVRTMRKDARFFERLFIAGGAIKQKDMERLFDEPEKLAKLAARYGVAVAQAALRAALDAGKLPLLEKAVDDYLYRLFTPYAHSADSLDTLIGFLLRSQREATDVRLIMTGKLNDFTPEAVAERVRELHG